MKTLKKSLAILLAALMALSVFAVAAFAADDVDENLDPVFTLLPTADSDDLALHGLLLRGVGDDDPSDGLVLLFDGLHQHAVAQRSDFHFVSLLVVFSIALDCNRLQPNALLKPTSS